MSKVIDGDLKGVDLIQSHTTNLPRDQRGLASLVCTLPLPSPLGWQTAGGAESAELATEASHSLLDPLDYRTIATVIA